MIERSPLPPRTSRLRSISKKRRTQLGLRRRAVAARMERSGGRCEATTIGVTCEGPLHPHEPLTRARGGSITDVENIRMVCAAHHRWIHEHPRLAERAGLLASSWSA